MVYTYTYNDVIVGIVNFSFAAEASPVSMLRGLVASETDKINRTLKCDLDKALRRFCDEKILHSLPNSRQEHFISCTFSWQRFLSLSRDERITESQMSWIRFVEDCNPCLRDAFSLCLLYRGSTDSTHCCRYASSYCSFGWMFPYSRGTARRVQNSFFFLIH